VIDLAGRPINAFDYNAGAYGGGIDFDGRRCSGCRIAPSTT
jgi:hypothetical protein